MNFTENTTENYGQTKFFVLLYRPGQTGDCGQYSFKCELQMMRFVLEKSSAGFAVRIFNIN